MYEYILVLNGQNYDLATFEFENLWNIYKKEKITLIKISHSYYSFKSSKLLKQNSKFLFRLTFTNNIYRVLFSSETLNNYEDKSKIFTIKKNLSSFAVRVKKINYNDNSYSYDSYLKPIWKKLNKLKLNLNNPEIEYFILDNNKAPDTNSIKFSIKLFENKKEFLPRMPKLRPIAKPYTLKSDLGRCIINYLNISKGTVLDPFAGIGGILLEAESMGFKIIANDINWTDLQNLKTNFNHYFPNNSITITIADAKTKFLKENSIDGIVTDIPYGKSSRIKGNSLYEDFLKASKYYLKPNKRIIIIYANFLEFKEIALKYFIEVKEITQYINKNLSRQILILENKK